MGRCDAASRNRFFMRAEEEEATLLFLSMFNTAAADQSIIMRGAR